MAASRPLRRLEAQFPKVIETRLKQPWHTVQLRVPRLFQPCFVKPPLP
jgi:hypothetical protein